MRLHGWVSLALLAAVRPSFSQEIDVVPRPLDPIDRYIAPELIDVPQPGSPIRSVPRAIEQTPLEAEIEALRADLQSFRALSDDVGRSVRAAEIEADRTMVRQRQEMLDILTRLVTRGIEGRPGRKAESKAAAPAIPEIPVMPDSVSVPAVTDATVDPFALGKSLFRAGEYARAEQAFRKVVATDDNRLILKYLIATCLRKRSQWQAAIDLYREVAASDKDPVLRDLAKFQLDGIRWNQDTEKQIEQLRKQRARTSVSPGSVP
jgi:tetratricopeptide (TPR) repeat protein